MSATEAEGISGWLTLDAVAQMLGCTREAVRQRVWRHRLPHMTVGSSMLVRLSDIRRTLPER